MKPFFHSVSDLVAGEQLLRKRHYGVIEVVQGQLIQIRLRPWPKIGSVVEARWISSWKSRLRPVDSCLLYYNQPIQHPNFLALTYLESSQRSSLKTIFLALKTLDHIAKLKRSDAILAEVSNPDISNRILDKLGWEQHLPHKRQRHWIKRFYGNYPQDSKRESDLCHTN